MKKVFSAHINIKPTTRKEPQKGKHGNMYLPKKTRDYYYALYAEYMSHKMPRLKPPPQQYYVYIRTYNKDNIWRDVDNIQKAIFDAGQPAQWVNKDKVGYVNLWNDKVFRHVNCRAFNGCKEDKIFILIKEI